MTKQMRSTLQLDVLKKILREQHGVPDSICDSLDNIYRLSYTEGWADHAAELAEEDSLGEDN